MTLCRLTDLRTMTHTLRRAAAVVATSVAAATLMWVVSAVASLRG
jgi:hypothetical protein